MKFGLIKLPTESLLGNLYITMHPEVDEESGEFGIPSPILSGNYRNKFQQQIEIANDLIIEEVSDVTNTGDYIF